MTVSVCAEGAQEISRTNFETAPVDSVLTGVQLCGVAGFELTYLNADTQFHGAVRADKKEGRLLRPSPIRLCELLNSRGIKI